MADIKQNTTYQNYGELTRPLIGAAYRIGSQNRRPAAKETIAPYKQLAVQTQNAASPTKTSTPTTMGNLGTITTQYGGSTKFEAFHPGIDIANQEGTPIPAFASGKVVEIATGQKRGDPGFGNFTIVQDAQGNKWRYSHLRSEFVKVGDVVNKGQVIGEMGSTGSVYSLYGNLGTHLDIRIQSLAGKYLNPETLIGI